MIELQWHEVMNGSYHSLIRITPDDQKHWSKDMRFTKRDKIGRLFLTLGAGPEWGVLVSVINRS